MSEKSQSTHSGDLVTDAPEITLEDLCQACGVTKEQVVTYVSEGIIEPKDPKGTQWRFSQLSLIQVRRASRIEHDLGLNAAGVALVFDLMAEIKKLNSRLAHLERENK